MHDVLQLVINKRKTFEHQVDRLGTGSGISFRYVGKPKTFFTDKGAMLRFQGFEILDRVKGKLKKRGKVLLKHRKSGELVRVSFRDIEVIT